MVQWRDTRSRPCHGGFWWNGGLGAREAFWLAQWVLLPIVYYGIEFVTGFQRYVNRIGIAVSSGPPLAAKQGTCTARQVRGRSGTYLGQMSVLEGITA